MNRPLFEVGEVVVLQSKKVPEFNGEHQVLEVAGPGETVIVDGSHKKNNLPRHVYRLGVIGPTGSGFWSESLLRKRHQPGEYSFDVLKQILAMPVSRGDLA